MRIWSSYGRNAYVNSRDGVFDKTLETLEADDPKAHDCFGIWVDDNGKTIAVSVSLVDDGKINARAVCLFR